jgi:cob(I)alamin adenosyltransferase
MRPGRKRQRGTVQVYTGNGKGKTTAALGTALRAAGWGMRTYMGQFMKGQHYGELDTIRTRLKDLITIEQFGKKSFIHVGRKPSRRDLELARRALEACRSAMLSGRYALVILDEVNVAVFFKLLDEKDVHELLDARPEEVEVILTGRYAPESFLERADLVTEMREVKHHFAAGIKARNGIER